MISRCLAASLVLVGCTDEIVLEPIIDVPVNDSDAFPFTTLDEITLSIARAGDERDLVTQRFQRGETLELPGAPFGDDLVVHMFGYQEQDLDAYGRTCEISVDSSGASEQPHLFFSRSRRFANTGLTSLSRTGGRSIALDGAAILIGGIAATKPVPQIERFDPRTGELTTIGMVMERVGAVEARLGTSPERVVILGGRVGTVGASFLEVIDTERSITLIRDSHMPRVGLTATTLTDGRVIAIGGNEPGASPVGTLTEIVVNGTDVVVSDLRNVTLANPRTGHTATRLGDYLGAPVLIAGGIDTNGAPVAVAELFKPLTDELARPSTFAWPMVYPRSGHSAALMPDGGVLFIGGLDAAGNQVRTLEKFSLDGGFVVVGELPDNAAVLDPTVTVLPDGRILIAGGRNEPMGFPSDTAFVAIQRDDGLVNVVQTNFLGVARAGHQAVVLCDGTVLVTGGADGDAPIERYNPPPDGRR